MTASFTNSLVNSGFDDSVSPPWQMVPVGGVRTIHLQDGSGLTVTSADDTVATVTEVPGAFTPLLNARTFVVRGCRKGTTVLRAGPGVELAVGVKALKRIKTTFHLVTDTATPPHSTSRNETSVTDLLRHANEILFGQANVRLDKHDVKNTTISADLGATVRYSSHISGVAASEHEWDDVVAHRDASADFNVFLVWDYEQDSTPNTDNANAGTKASEGNCLLEDAIAVPGRTLAHETAHALSVHDHSTQASNLMSAAPRVRGRGEAMTRSQIDAINP